MKLSVNFQNETEKALKAFATKRDASVSSVVEIAVSHLLSLSDEEYDQIVFSAEIEKKARTASGWREAFWQLMSIQFGRDPKSSHVLGRPYGPFQFGCCQVVFLLPTPDGTEDGSITPHAMVLSEAGTETQTWDFSVKHSVTDAVDSVSMWVRKRMNQAQ